MLRPCHFVLTELVKCPYRNADPNVLYLPHHTCWKQSLGLCVVPLDTNTPGRNKATHCYWTQKEYEYCLSKSMMSCMSLYQILTRHSVLAQIFMQKIQMKQRDDFDSPGWTTAKQWDCSQSGPGTKLNFALLCQAMPNLTLKFPEIWKCKYPSWK